MRNGSHLPLYTFRESLSQKSKNGLNSHEMVATYPLTDFVRVQLICKSSWLFFYSRWFSTLTKWSTLPILGCPLVKLTFVKFAENLSIGSLTDIMGIAKFWGLNINPISRYMYFYIQLEARAGSSIACFQVKEKARILSRAHSFFPFIFSPSLTPLYVTERRTRSSELH